MTEATATFTAPHWDSTDLAVDDLLADPRTLPAEAIISRTEYALGGRFATIATVAQVVAGQEALTGS